MHGSGMYKGMVQSLSWEGNLHPGTRPLQLVLVGLLRTKAILSSHGAVFLSILQMRPSLVPAKTEREVDNHFVSCLPSLLSLVHRYKALKGADYSALGSALLACKGALFESLRWVLNVFLFLITCFFMRLMSSGNHPRWKQ